MSDHEHSHNYSNVKVAFFLNFGFAILEIIGGFFINSIAIMSDALHDLGDSLSLGLSWFLGRYSQKKENKQFTYGYRRYSLLAALINTVVLIVGSILILVNAIPRILDPQPTNATGMIVFAILGVLVNGFAAFKMKGGRSLNEKVVSWHLLEDVLGWVAVLIVGIVMYFKEIPILDPILSVLITSYILYNVAINFKKTILLFLQSVPEDVDLNKLLKQFVEIDKVNSTHHTHVWSLDSEYHVLSTHLVVDNSANLEDIKEIKKKARDLLKDLNMEHTTIEIEFESDNCEVLEN